MHKATGHTLVEICRHCLVVFANTALVANRPEEHAGAVLIALHHTLGTVEVSVCPLVIVGQGIPFTKHTKAVCFEVCLVTNVKTEAIAKLKEARIVGIVACTNHIDIVRFEDVKVAQHMLHRGGTAELRMAIVAINALALDLFAVDVEHLAANFKTADADFLANHFVAALYIQYVKIGLFVAPKSRIFNFDSKICGSINRFFSGCDFYTRGRNKAVRNLRFARYGQFGSHGCVGEIIF